MEVAKMNSTLLEAIIDTFIDLRNNQDIDVVFDLDKLQMIGVTGEDFDKIFRKTISNVLDEYRIKDKTVSVICGRKKFEMSFAKLIINMVFWKPYFVFNKHIKSTDIIEVPDECTFNKELTRYTEETLIKFRDMFDESEQHHVEEVASMIIRDLVRLTDIFSVCTLNSFSIYDIVKLTERSGAFSACVNHQIDDSKPVPEIVDELNRGQGMVIDAIKSDGQSELLPFIACNVFKKDQLAQTFFSIGLRSDADNKVIPYVVNTNFLNGFKNIIEYYTECEVARYATIVKDQNVGDSGYLSREFDLLTHSIKINRHVNDCGTKITLPYFVKNDFYLNMIRNKIYVDKNGKLAKINYNDDKHLIGKVVELRSMVGCACERPFVCKTCAGNHNFSQLEPHIGSCVSVNMISRFTQASMSVKHSTTVDSIDIDDETLLEYFDIIGDQMYLKENINVSELVLLFEREYIEDILEKSKRSNRAIDSDDDDTIDSSIEPIRQMELFDKRYDSERDTVIPYKKQIILDDTYIQFSEEVMSNRKNFIVTHNSPTAALHFKNIPKDVPIFDITYIAKNVASHIFNIRKIMRTDVEGSFREIVPQHMNQLIEIVENGGYRDIMLTNIECIYYSLVKDIDNVFMRPNHKTSNPNVSIIKLKTAIGVNSFSDGLAHEDLCSLFRNHAMFLYDTLGSNDIRYSVSKMYKIDHVKDMVRRELPGMIK